MIDAAEPEPTKGDIFESIWSFFSSVKLALVLIIVLAVASLLGALIVQVPGEYARDPATYSLWLERVMRPKYGSWTDVLNALRLFDVYNATWFRLIMAALAFNVIICTLNRLPALWASVFSPRLRMNDAFYAHAPTSIRIQGQGLTIEPWRRVLMRNRYKVQVEKGDGVVYFYGDRNGIAKLGTFATHLSIVVFLAGAVAGSVFGFAIDGVVIPEGQTYELRQNGLALDVRNDNFTVEFYPDGRPKDYRSDLVVIENGKEVAKKTIRVNDPLVYKGVRFHQAFYGAFANVRVTDSSGSRLYSGQIGLNPQGSIYQGWIALPDGMREIAVELTAGREQGANFQIWDAQGAGPVGYVNKGETGTLGDLQITLEDVGQYTGLRIARDPGSILIWIASGLIIVGLAATFYFPRRRLWGRLTESEAIVAGNADRFVNLQQELRLLAEAVKRAVPGVDTGESQIAKAEGPGVGRTVKQKRR
jgi:cytochrome c biogenesis protein